ncbi:hypothetical protein ACHAXT_000037 [Thalassiosira profunda]
MTKQHHLASVGNACHALSTLSVAAYTAATFLYAKPGSDFFDEDWVQHGFCVVGKDVPYMNSHDLCLYFDVVLVAAGLLIYRVLRGMPVPDMKVADELLLFNLLGHLGHGILHGYIGSMFRNGSYKGAEEITEMEKLMVLSSEEEDSAKLQIVTRVMIGILFWVGLLKGVVPKVSMGVVSVLAVLIYIVGTCVRDVLGFAYVNAVITVAFSYSQLAMPREAKQYVYAAFAAVAMPITIIPWIECTMCTEFLSKFGGHLVFDVSIPVLLTAAYCLSWRHHSAHLETKGKRA